MPAEDWAGSGYWVSFAFALARGARVSAVFGNFAVAGQGTLLVMYVFGIFHKLNTGFLDPATSCAVALWQEMPVPLAWFDGPFVSHVAIYGTFLAEGAIIGALLTRRLRHWGIVCGIAFHLLLALSGYAMYITFSALAIALHVLFLSGEGAGRIVASRGLGMVRLRLRNPAYALLGLTLIAGLAWPPGSRRTRSRRSSRCRSWRPSAFWWCATGVPPSRSSRSRDRCGRCLRRSSGPW